MVDPVARALRVVGEHMSFDVLEAPRVLGPESGALLDGLRSRGYVNEARSRIALSEVGERALGDCHGSPEA